MPRATDRKWSPEEDNLILCGLREGLSHAEIARTLPNPSTRHAVTGRLARLADPRFPRHRDFDPFKGHRRPLTYTHCVSVTVDEEMYTFLRAQAKAERMSLSELIRTFIEWGFEALEES